MEAVEHIFVLLKLSRCTLPYVLVVNASRYKHTNISVDAVAACWHVHSHKQLGVKWVGKQKFGVSH